MTTTIQPKPRVRAAWEDRFNQPAFEAMLAHLDEPARALFDEVHELFQSYDERITHQISWQGLPMRWCLSYSLPGDPTRAFGYLAPCRPNILVCIPLNAAMIQALPMRRIKKFVRERLVTNRVVGDVYWCDWDVSAKTQVSDIMDIAKRKHRFLTEAASS